MARKTKVIDVQVEVNGHKLSGFDPNKVVEVHRTSRFDYVKYDSSSMAAQEIFKRMVIGLEEAISQLPDGRAKALAITKLEEVYMWIGKALRDHQIARNGSATLQEERTNG